jgi:hypothetical protein
LSYGRFSEVFQFDAEWPGNPAQQLAIVKTFELEYGSDRWKLVKRLDKSTNEVWQRHYLAIGFPPDEMFGWNQLAVAGVTGINFRQSYNASALPMAADHELGHVVDKHLLLWKDRLWFMAQAGIDANLNTWNQNVQETWADAFRDWWRGQSWKSLDPILIPG